MTSETAAPGPPGAAVFFSTAARAFLPVLALAASGAAVVFLWGSPPAPPRSGPPLRLVGRVAGHPRGAATGDIVAVRAEWIHEGGTTRAARGRWRVFRRAPSRPWAWGDRVSVEGVPRFADAGENLLWAFPGRDRLVARASRADPRRWMAAARQACREAFRVRLGPVSGPLMAGLLLGERPPADSALALDFRRSGALHLLVASGTNVGFVVALWWVFVRWGLWWPRRWALLSVPAVAFFYAGIAGNDPPVLRAAFMAAVVAIAAFVRRWDRPLRVLCFSGVALTLARPGVFFHPGFQMSYAATAALLWGWRGRAAGGDDVPSKRSGLGDRVGRLWRASSAAQLALAPFLLYYFGRFSWVGIFSNLVAVPLAELALGLGAGLGFLHTVWPWAGGVLVIPTEGVLRALAAWARVCARLPAAEVSWSLSLTGAIVLGGGVLVGFGAVRSVRYKKVGWAVAALLVFGGLWAGAPPPSEWRVRWQGGRVRKIVMTRGDAVYTVRVSTAGAGPLWENGGDGRGAPGVLRRPTGPGYAFDIDTPAGRLLVAVGLSRAQQKALLREGLSRVEVLGWTPAGRGPPSEEFLRALSPRWVVYQGPRLPKAVRALDPPAGVYRAGAAGVTVALDKNGWRLTPGPER